MSLFLYISQYFYIIDFNRNTILSSTFVYLGIFNTKERKNPILMSPEKEVAFVGYNNQDVSALQQTSSTPILDGKIERHTVMSTAQLKPTFRFKI